MKPFNLEEYLADPTKRVITRDGRPVRIICTDAKGICPVVGLVAYENYELAFNAMKDGRIDGISDFFFAPEKHEGWVNIYRYLINNDPYCNNVIYASEEEARHNSGTACATVKIEWEE